MRATTFLLSAALTLCGTASFAQSSYNVVVEPVSQSIDSIINAPIEYDENGVVKAQHFNANDLTAEEYQAVLDEAARIRSYRSANGLNFEADYITPNYVEPEVVQPEYVAPEYVTSSAPVDASSYQIELFAPETSSVASVAPTYSAPLQTYSAPVPSYAGTSARRHTVSKGETLYRISKLYGVSVPAIQAENSMANSTSLSVGQVVRIPGAVIESVNRVEVAQPIYVNSTVQNSSSTHRRVVVEPTPVYQSPQIDTSVGSEAVYAVLPKDTLYSISRRTCVGVRDIISRNEILNPNALTPGQRLTLPAGHCLQR